MIQFLDGSFLFYYHDLSEIVSLGVAVTLDHLTLNLVRDNGCNYIARLFVNNNEMEK